MKSYQRTNGERVHWKTPKYAPCLTYQCTRRAQVGDLQKLKSGNWRVQVRRKGYYLIERSDVTPTWKDGPSQPSVGSTAATPKKRVRVDPTTFGPLIDLHIDDLKEVGKAPRRSEAFTLDALQAKLGSVEIGDLTCERLIQLAKGPSLYKPR